MTAITRRWEVCRDCKHLGYYSLFNNNELTCTAGLSETLCESGRGVAKFYCQPPTKIYQAVNRMEINIVPDECDNETFVTLKRLAEL